MILNLPGCSVKGDRDLKEEATDTQTDDNKEDEQEVNNMRYVLENEFLKVEVSELGATLVRFIDKKTGQDIVLGYNDDDAYLRNAFNLGASIGRNANRIENGSFMLNGKHIQLTVNDHGNQLHGGGKEGFAFKHWDLVSKSDDEVVFSYLSKDGEQGFPGNLKAQIRYKIDKNTLLWEYSGEADEDTLFNMTNHTYFNLGDKTILDEYLHINTDRYAPVNEVALTLDEVRDVKDTPYDFTEFTRVGDNLSRINNIDNNYVWETMGDKLMAELKNDKLKLSVYSDLPDMHLFTASGLNTDTGKEGVPYGNYGGLALECQFFPNGINYGDKYILPILRKGEKACHYMRYVLEGVE
ncbi:MAG: galactose mutarotase [Erysipelotrichaceae bacterium]|nr:galactose mutarotase [Erysipelotrichaceae bacterium]